MAAKNTRSLDQSKSCACGSKGVGRHLPFGRPRIALDRGCVEDEPQKATFRYVALCSIRDQVSVEPCCGWSPTQPRSAEEGVLFSQEFGDRFRAGADLKFFVDSANIGVNRLVTDAKFFRDFLVEKALAEAIEHFLFTLGKI